MKKILFLYVSVLFSRPKSILEIGHFLGKSTAAICQAIRDAELTTRFDSFDFPHQSTEAFESYYSGIHKKTVHASKDYTDIFDSGLKFTHVAKRNLESIGLASYVNLIAQDFRKSEYKSYDLIFADVLHDSAEILHNLAEILEFGHNETIYMFDDMNYQNIRLIESQSKLTLIRQTGKIGAFRISSN
jgi:predicted O-methyltransferase YrrM